MKHHKKPDGSVHGIDEGQEHLITPDMILMSEAEFELCRNPPKTPEQLEVEAIAAFISALESHYDLAAQSRRYDNRLTCTLRAGYPGPFQAEGLAFAVWMDECNAYAYGQMDLVKSGERSQPTPDELVAELQPMAWPE